VRAKLSKRHFLEWYQTEKLRVEGGKSEEPEFVALLPFLELKRIPRPALREIAPQNCDYVALFASTIDGGGDTEISGYAWTLDKIEK
jgi:hypothetical protein